ncbi:uncharacterized protein CLUP02_08819 [Colletotrichum lupini]|uniref:Uncharacterized protein n=1 Tax=Colletotrichum lupini TaxID=145971 RepID=A0A9Q8STH5_9PEZI|nr:uncharacterized protein CLUP02_08819 [Colletotrichum lupini]UQC83324.1 hypothetical protein CLUP02_08819 [Colletotrichum lupini]
MSGSSLTSSVFVTKACIVWLCAQRPVALAPYPVGSRDLELAKIDRNAETKLSATRLLPSPFETSVVQHGRIGPSNRSDNNTMQFGNLICDPVLWFEKYDKLAPRRSRRFPPALHCISKKSGPLLKSLINSSNLVFTKRNLLLWIGVTFGWILDACRVTKPANLLIDFCTSDFVTRFDLEEQDSSLFVARELSRAFDLRQSGQFGTRQEPVYQTRRPTVGTPFSLIEPHPADDAFGRCAISHFATESEITSHEHECDDFTHFVPIRNPPHEHMMPRPSVFIILQILNLMRPSTAWIALVLHETHDRNLPSAAGPNKGRELGKRWYSTCEWTVHKVNEESDFQKAASQKGVVDNDRVWCYCTIWTFAEPACIGRLWPAIARMRWGTQQLGATKNRQRVTKSSEPISDPAIKISDNRSLPRQASLQAREASMACTCCWKAFEHPVDKWNRRRGLGISPDAAISEAGQAPGKASDHLTGMSSAGDFN